MLPEHHSLGAPTRTSCPHLLPTQQDEPTELLCHLPRMWLIKLLTQRRPTNRP